tara:strand:- start:741 stop:1052 length:312 start_codon:yes stop_codon:yes gene_type:complete
MSELINIINGVPTPFTDEEKAQREKDIADYNSDASKLSRIKILRQQFLEQTDWWVLRGNMTDAQTQYRQKLRDIPANYDNSKYDELLARDEQGNLTHTVWEKP